MKREKRTREAAPSFTEVLFDATNESRLVLSDADKRIVFDQVYATQRGGVVHTILCPVTEIQGVAEGAALVFRLLDDGRLAVERDAAIADEVFAEYYSILPTKEVKND